MSGGVPAGELLPCPFCGGVDGDLVQAFTRASDDFAFWSVECLSCGAEIADDESQEAADRHWNTRATPTPPSRDADVERVDAPENGETRPDWAGIKRAIDYFVGRVPTIGKHRAINNAHIRTVVERLDAAGDREAADTIVWQCWYRALDAERERFLLSDKDEQLSEAAARIEALEAEKVDLLGTIRQLLDGRAGARDAARALLAKDHPHAD